MVEAQYRFMLECVTKNKFSGSFYEVNECKGAFLYLLKSKDDTLILLTCSLIYSILTISKASPSLLFRANFYPIGLRRKKLLL